MVSDILAGSQESTGTFLHWRLEFAIGWKDKDLVVLALHTDKRANQIFLIYRKIRSGAVAKSNIRKGNI
jgi:hypothetical protein